jgi:DNA repair protein RecN (Recombination protein N)
VSAAKVSAAKGSAVGGSQIRELGVAGLAIIDAVRVEFGPGLTVLTGETGAGKSLIVDALALARGARADAGAIRTGEDRLRVDLLMSGEGGEQIIVREVHAEGRSVARIDDELVTIGRLAAEVAPRIEIHGQHDQQRLGDRSRQRDLLDRWTKSLALREEIGSLVDARANLLSEFEALGGDDARREALLVIARAERDDLLAAAVEPGEGERLREELRRASSGDRIETLRGEILELLDGDDSGMRGQSRLLDRTAGELRKLDEGAAALAERISALAIEIDDLARDVAGRGAAEAPARPVAEIEERLGLILSLERRFRTDEAGLADALERATAEVQRLEGAATRQGAITKERAELAAQIGALALKLRAARAAGASSLKKAVNTALSALALPPTFEIDLQPRRGGGDDPLVDGAPCLVDRSGADEVEYLFAPNAGEPAAPIAKIASGGELSRVSLALEEALSDASEGRTLIFDEIDAGLGGRAGETLGRSLKRIATQHQVLCVTHLPQVAAQADVHLHVSKREEGGRTITQVRRLSDAERVAELASMLAGDGAGSGAEAAARELLVKAGRNGS